MPIDLKMHFKHLVRFLQPNIAPLNKIVHAGLSQKPAEREKLDEEEKRRQKIMGKGLPKVKPIPNVKHIILIASGKGGVGKSTTAVNLATALKSEYPDNNIGLLDTDVFGPTVPQMMNLNETPILNDNNLMVPLVNYGVKCMSMGFLIDETAAVIWRGLMVMQALDKLMRQVHWGPTDCLIVDTPPGTGDTQLSIVQNLPVSGVILVTTPQSASIQVTRRGAKLFQKLNVPLIGLVENMSSVKCPACLNDVQLFGSGTATGTGSSVQELAVELDTKVVLSVPLEKEIGAGADKGVPIIIAKPNSNEAKCYKRLANITNEYMRTVPYA